MCLTRSVLVIGTHLPLYYLSAHRYQYVDILWFNVIFAVYLFDHYFLNQLFSPFMFLCVYFFPKVYLNLFILLYFLLSLS